MAFSTDGRLLAIAGEDTASGYGFLRLWNLGTGRSAPLGGRLRQPDGVDAVAFSPDGKLLASAGQEGSGPVGTVRLWSVMTGHAVRALPCAPTQGLVTASGQWRSAPDGRLLASADGDGTVRLWKTATLQPAGPPLHADSSTRGGVEGVAFSPDGGLLASADGDGTVRLWNPATGRSLGVPIPADTTAGIAGVAFSPRGSLLATADQDGTVRLWRVSAFARPYAALCADVGPPTRHDWNRYAPGEPEPPIYGRE